MISRFLTPVNPLFSRLLLWAAFLSTTRWDTPGVARGQEEVEQRIAAGPATVDQERAGGAARCIDAPCAAVFFGFVGVQWSDRWLEVDVGNHHRFWVNFITTEACSKPGIMGRIREIIPKWPVTFQVSEFMIIYPDSGTWRKHGDETKQKNGYVSWIYNRRFLAEFAAFGGAEVWGFWWVDNGMVISHKPHVCWGMTPTTMVNYITPQGGEERGCESWAAISGSFHTKGDCIYNFK